MNPGITSDSRLPSEVIPEQLLGESHPNILTFPLTYTSTRPPDTASLPRGGGGTPYNGLYREAPPERGTFFRLQVYKRVGISQV